MDTLKKDIIDFHNPSFALQSNAETSQLRSDKHKFRFKVLKMLNGVKSQQCCLSWETVAKGWPNRFCSIHYGLRARAHGTDDRYSITQVLFKNTLTNARNSIYPYLVSGHFPWKVDLLYNT